MDIEPISAENEAKLAKNDKIMEDLEKNVKIIVKGIDFDIKDHFHPDEVDGFKTLWENLRDILDVINVDENGDESYCRLIPANHKELRHFLEVMNDNFVEIDCVIQRDLPDVDNPKELAFNLKQFCKDYLWGTLNIMESDPNITIDEVDNQLMELDENLKSALYRRAGYDYSVDDVILYTLTPEEHQKADIKNINTEKKPSKADKPDIPLGRRKFK